MEIDIIIRNPDDETVAWLLRARSASPTAASPASTTPQPVADPAGPTIQASGLTRDQKRLVLTEILGTTRHRRRAVLLPLAAAAPDPVSYQTLLDALAEDEPETSPNEAWGGVRHNINMNYREEAGVDLIHGSKTRGYYLEDEEGALLREIISS